MQTPPGEQRAPGHTPHCSRPQWDNQGILPTGRDTPKEFPLTGPAGGVGVGRLQPLQDEVQGEDHHKCFLTLHALPDPPCEQGF